MKLIVDMEKGIALVLLIFLLVASSLAAVVAFSLLAQGATTGLGQSECMQAYAIAIGAKEWYLQQLANDTDWTDEADQTNIPLGQGSFDIGINNALASNVSFTATGRLTGYFNQTVQRQISLTAKKLPKACRFAVFWGRDTGSTLQLRNSTTINGSLWSRGNTEVRSGCSVTSIAYCPNDKSITGAGTFTEQKISSPPDMPPIDEAYYSNLIDSFDSFITTYGTGSDRNQNTDLVLNGDIIGCRHFTTNGNITISGYGYIVASRNIRLHSLNSATGTLTISPSGGNIYFLAARSLLVNSNRNDASVIINNGAYLYSQARTATNQLVSIRKSTSATTNINSSLILARRRVYVRDGSSLSNCTLYVSDVSDRDNYLRIRDTGTSVTGSIISVSGRNPGLSIDNGASVTGLVYHWGDNTGYTYLDDATIDGAVVASQFRRDRINNCTITYSPTSIASLTPQGFDDYVMTEPNSWDDN